MVDLSEENAYYAIHGNHSVLLCSFLLFPQERSRPKYVITVQLRFASLHLIASNLGKLHFNKYVHFLTCNCNQVRGF